ncbi:MAG: adenosylmethionine--8-amino-7-oxononanoate transaminase [Marinilabiliales bacterium]|nr:MAG: adenosylmethionine--8-amino-7-oxononanoate transaminase [Marinilabiliales bacterium]
MNELIEKDLQYVWHPFSQKEDDDLMLVADHAKGSKVYTTDGRELIDIVSSWWVNMHGHSHPYIAEKIYEQALRMEHVIFAAFTHNPAVELSERIVKLTPDGLDRVFFSDNGSTAVEVALKMAIQLRKIQGYTQVPVLALHNSYHGDTFGAMALGERGIFTAYHQDMFFDVYYLTVPEDEEGWLAFEAACKANKGGVFIYEPLVQGAGGMLMYSPETLQKMQQICRNNDILLIADEVMTGFGRTGKMFASEYSPISPDFMCLSKGLTGGYMPMSLTLCSNETYELFKAKKERVFYHGHSYTANPLACAASLASLDLFEKEKTLEKIALIAEWHTAFSEKLVAQPKVKNIRQQGAILAFDIISEEETGYLNSLRRQVLEFFPKNGVLLRPLGNTLYLLPPYSLTKEEHGFVCDVILRFLNAD